MLINLFFKGKYKIKPKKRSKFNFIQILFYLLNVQY